MNTRLRTAIAGAIAAVAFNCTALADIIHLKNGNALEGKILEEAEESIKLNMPVGNITINRSEVDRIERKISPMEIYEGEAAQLDDDDSVGHYVLGMWCNKNGLTRPAEAEFLKTIAANPDHAQARKELGHVMHAGKWMTYDESMQAKGFVKADGKWMTPEDADAVASKKQQKEWLRKLQRAADLMCGSQLARGKQVFEQISIGEDSANLVPALREITAHKCALARHEAIEALARLRTPDAFDAIVEAVLNERDDEIFAIAVQRLQQLNSKRAAKLLAKVCGELRKTIPTVSNEHKPSTVAAIRRASKAMGVIGDQSAVPELARCVILEVNYLQEVDGTTNLAGLSGSTMTELGPVSVGGASIGLQGQRTSGVSISSRAKTLQLVPNYLNREAAEALTRITGERYDYDSKRWLQWWALHKPIFPPDPEIFELN